VNRPSARSWAFDLIAPDDAVRARALARHQALVEGSGAALRWTNRVWREAGTPLPTQPHLAAEMDQARADQRWHHDQTLFGHLDRFLDADLEDEVAHALYGPFVVLYLRWEACHPAEWRSPASDLWSPWSRKEVVLRRLGRFGVPEGMRPDVANLVITALHRQYRCKDWMYAQLVPHVADSGFRARVSALLHAPDPVIGLRARFVLDIADQPERRVTRATWRRWLELHRLP